VAQDVGPEFKPQYRKKKTTKVWEGLIAQDSKTDIEKGKETSSRNTK
jgi:hypothetical protein